VLIRPARPTDAAALAGVHVASWQRAYRGLLPDAYLDGLDVDRWTTRWEAALAEVDWPRRGTLVAESSSGGVIGFLDAVPSRDDDAGPATAEVTSLYVTPKHWDGGIGRALMTERARAQQLTASTAWSSAP
jgi:GNAT superfamily N-acetyltransferase